VGVTVVGAGPPVGLPEPEAAALPGVLEGPVFPDIVQRQVIAS
jgi:hypothetical protein